MNESIPNISPLIKTAADGLSEKERDGTKRQLAKKLRELQTVTSADPLQRARLQLDIAEALNTLERKKEAWDIAREAFVTALQQESWQDAVEACDVLYQAGQEDSIAVLGMGVWLAVTFPVDPELTAAMLIHVVDETPDDADGTAVAAITARYVVDLRADDNRHEDLCFLTDNLIATVAKRHSNVQDQEAMSHWLERLQLRDPQVFIPRMGKVVDTLVGGRWWFDRDELRNKLPD